MTSNAAAPLWVLSGALDLIYDLRTACAVERMILNATVDYATFPAGRRRSAQTQIRRLARAASGHAEQALIETVTSAGDITLLELARRSAQVPGADEIDLAVEVRAAQPGWVSRVEHTSSYASEVETSLIGRAASEIVHLRAVLAYDAHVLQAHLMLASFPKGRRGVTETQVERMLATAEGTVGRYREIDPRSAAAARTSAGMAQTLNRSTWETESRTSAA